MPQVPVYDDRQVRTQALQPVFQNTPDVSSGAKALAQGLGQVAEAVDRIDLRDAQDAAFKAEAKVREEWQLHRSKLRQQYKGDQADQYKAAADEWWNKARETYGEELSPRAQALAGRSLQQYRLAQDADTLGYVESEKTRAREINFKTLQANTSREALQNATVENAGVLASTTVPLLRENAIKYAVANGLSSDVGEAMARDQIDNFHKSMALMLATRPDGMEAAQAYITENSKDMPPADRDAVNRQIEITANQATRQREEKASDAAWQLFAQNKRVPEDILRDMDGRERAQLQREQQSRYERSATGAAVKTNPVTLAKIYDLMRDNPAEFKTLRMGSLIEHVSPSDMEQIARIQRDMNKPSAEKDVATTAQLLSTYTGGYKPEKKAAFSQVFFDELNKLEKEKGRPATYDEKRKLGDRLIIDGEVLSGSMWLNDPNKKYYEATPEERARFVPTITSSDRKLVRDALAAEGVKNPTEAEIVKRFKLAKGFR